ncbi:hypothetical protein ACN1C3_30040 [Pseudomonas sp. H11T01]|uniref:hypothetical protein n=1 Tax=Pseudomonas sp. H11T01 TaxID=3402749 RepID=UPI003AD338BF
MAVKQLFETYVYDQTLSSTVQVPFVIDGLNAAQAKACSEYAALADQEKNS